MFNASVCHKSMIRSLGVSLKRLGTDYVDLFWLRTGRGSVVPIIGARKMDQIRDNLGCLDVRIPEDKLHTLEQVSHVDLGFLHDFFKSRKDRLYGGAYSRLIEHREP